MRGPRVRTIQHLGLISLGGALGSIVRVWLENHLGAGPGFAGGVFAANLSGALIIGLVVGATERLAPDSAQRLRLLVATGFCGGLTTLSSLALVLAETVEQHRLLSAVTYALVTLSAGVAALVAARAGLLALVLARQRTRRARGQRTRVVEEEVCDG